MIHRNTRVTKKSTLTHTKFYEFWAYKALNQIITDLFVTHIILNHLYNFTRNKVIAKERDKIIEEHAPHVFGYLAAGVLRREDLPTVRKGAERHPHLANMDIESIAKSKEWKTRPKCNAQCLVLKSL